MRRRQPYFATFLPESGNAFPRTVDRFTPANERGRRAATRDVLALMESRNRSGDRSLVLPSEYLEVVIKRK